MCNLVRLAGRDGVEYVINPLENTDIHDELANLCCLARCWAEYALKPCGRVSFSDRLRNDCINNGILEGA